VLVLLLLLLLLLLWLYLKDVSCVISQEGFQSLVVALIGSIPDILDAMKQHNKHQAMKANEETLGKEDCQRKQKQIKHDSKYLEQYQSKLKNTRIITFR
jgi:hypothetical protein